VRVGATPFSDPRQLAAIDELIREKPDEVALRFGRACCLEDLGRIDDALQAYVELLGREPTHFGGLTNLGSLLFERGYLAQARPYISAAVKLHPADPVALVNFAQLQASGDDDFDAAIATYTSSLQIKPDFLHAHLGLAAIYTETGHPELAQAHLDRAYTEPKAWSFPYRGSAPPLQVLLLVSAFGGDMVTNLFFDDDVVQKGVLLADSVRGKLDLPPYHVLFNAIGDADRSRPSLERAVAIAAASPAAVINQPSAVLRTGRVETMQRLRDVPGVRAPRTERIARETLTAGALALRRFTFPLLLRSPGHHAGDHFAVARTADELAEVTAELPGRDLLAIEYLDARGADGDVRKYRVVAVDGKLYPVHLAVAPQWKVHYFSAEMSDRPDHRAEEAAFLEDMAAVVGERGMRGLEAIVATMGLDYAGVDFGLDSAGTILVFEANATMAVYPPDDGELWGYRRRAVDRVIAAVRAMLVERAKTAGYG
jgi:Tfp pilus assembly protein PilF/glutathione synthase/RimK-type ligase-like ATP-grasp enzyme